VVPGRDDEHTLLSPSVQVREARARELTRCLLPANPFIEPPHPERLAVLRSIAVAIRRVVETVNRRPFA
jgi:hypothetical protein